MNKLNELVKHRDELLTNIGKFGDEGNETLINEVVSIEGEISRHTPANFEEAAPILKIAETALREEGMINEANMVLNVERAIITGALQP